MKPIRLLPLLAALAMFGSVPPGHALTLPGDRVSLNGYLDGTGGYDRIHGKGGTFGAYHFVNVLSGYVTERVRLVGEVTLENGGLYTDEDTQGIVEVRGFAELIVSRALRLNVGHFLSPFGGYNVIHDATPTYLSITPPRAIYWKRKIGKDENGAFVIDRPFAKDSAGLWACGEVDIQSWEAHYDAYLTHGRTRWHSENVFRDDNDDKGVGGNLTLRAPGGSLMGASFYTDRNGELGTGSGERVRVGNLQGTLVAGNATLSGEYMAGSVAAHMGLPTARPRGYFGQVAVRTGRITPYARYDHYVNRAYDETEILTTAGVNLRLRPRVFVKAETGFYAGGRNVAQAQLAVTY